MQWTVTKPERTTILASLLTYAQARERMAQAAIARGNTPVARICDNEARDAYKTRDHVMQQDAPHVDSFAQFDTERERPAGGFYDAHGAWIAD